MYLLLFYSGIEAAKYTSFTLLLLLTIATQCLDDNSSIQIHIKPSIHIVPELR